MTQEAIIRALQNGSLTSHEVSNLTGMPQATVLSTAKKLRAKGEITTEQVKVGRYWLAKYTLVNTKPETQGIFTRAEISRMNAQAMRMIKLKPDFRKQIANNQKI